MKAIETKYIPATEKHGARYKAFDLDGNSFVKAATGNRTSEECHADIAQMLADKMGWSGKLVGGATKSGYCFVFVS